MNESLFLFYYNLSKHSSSLWCSINDHCWALPWALEILDVDFSFWDSFWHVNTLGIYSKNHEYFREYIYSITWNRQTMMSNVMLLSMKNNFNWYPFFNHVAWHGLNGRKGKKKEEGLIEWNGMHKLNGNIVCIGYMHQLACSFTCK